MFRNILFIFAICALLVPAMPTHAQTTLQAGDLIKGSLSSVYYYHTDGKRYVFPTEKTFYSWYKNFDDVKTISDEQLGQITIGGNVTYNPHQVMLKITTDPKVYEVFAGGVLRHIANEALASELYLNWAQNVHDLPDPFFVNYTVGEPMTDASQKSEDSVFSISKDIELRDSSPSIVKPTNDYYYDAETGEIKLTSDDSVFFINPQHPYEITATTSRWYVQGVKDNQLIVWETGYDNSPGPCWNPFAEEEGSLPNTLYAIDLDDPNNWTAYHPSDLEKEIGKLEIDACVRSI